MKEDPMKEFPKESLEFKKRTIYKPVSSFCSINNFTDVLFKSFAC